MKVLREDVGLLLAGKRVPLQISTEVVLEGAKFTLGRARHCIISVKCFLLYPLESRMVPLHRFVRHCARTVGRSSEACGCIDSVFQPCAKLRHIVRSVISRSLSPRKKRPVGCVTCKKTCDCGGMLQPPEAVYTWF